VTRINAADNP